MKCIVYTYNIKASFINFFAKIVAGGQKVVGSNPVIPTNSHGLGHAF